MNRANSTVLISLIWVFYPKDKGAIERQSIYLLQEFYFFIYKLVLGSCFRFPFGWIMGVFIAMIN